MFRIIASLICVFIAGYFTRYAIEHWPSPIKRRLASLTGIPPQHSGNPVRKKWDWSGYTFPPPLRSEYPDFNRDISPSSRRIDVC